MDVVALLMFVNGELKELHKNESVCLLMFVNAEIKEALNLTKLQRGNRISINAGRKYIEKY